MTSNEKTSGLMRFIRHEASGGICLVAAAVLALLVTNLGLGEAYHHFLELSVSIKIGSVGIDQHLLHWINDGLMAIFFFLVGLEIKREVLEGNLSSPSQIGLPAVAALGGMAMPAIIYLSFTYGTAAQAGWAIPAATDIAFALGALALLGNRVPAALKIFLLALATLDDLGAIIIIALFYTAQLSLISLLLAIAALLVLIALNRMKVDRPAPYLIIGLLMWACVLQSGVHATLAGVALAFTIPLRKRNGKPLISHLEHQLHPYVAFAILPLFAFANAGLDLRGLSLAQLNQALPLGIMAGLSLGKPVGISLAVGLAVMLGAAKLPVGITWPHMLGVSALAGIGFTMSLFIGTLAFNQPDMIDAVRMGVICGSLISAVTGTFLLVFAAKHLS